jgi:hypothetical protein
MQERTALGSARTASRRTALAGVGALLAAGLRGGPVEAAAAGTPVAASGKGLLLVQAFTHGSLFPTQGDVGVIPFTAILWDAADRGFFSVAGGAAGFAPTDALIAGLAAGERPLAALLAPGAADGATPHVWALRLAYGGLGADPGAVTYQGEAVDQGEAAAWLGMTPLPLPDGAFDLNDGFLIIAGLPGLDLPEIVGVRLTLR